MEDNVRNKYYDAEGEIYAAYLHEQMETKRWRWRRQHMLLKVEPESLAEAAALIEVIYEFSTEHRINAEKAVLRISDILDTARVNYGRTEELMEMSNGYFLAHGSYWREKVRHSFLYRWLNGLELGAFLAVAEGIVVRTRFFTRPYKITLLALLMLFFLFVVLPLIYAWLKGPKISADERIYTWKMQ